MTDSANKGRQASFTWYSLPQFSICLIACFRLRLRKHSTLQDNIVKDLFPPESTQQKAQRCAMSLSYDPWLPRKLQINVNTNNHLLTKYTVLQIYMVLFFRSLWVLPIHWQTLEAFIIMTFSTGRLETCTGYHGWGEGAVKLCDVLEAGKKLEDQWCAEPLRFFNKQWWKRKDFSLNQELPRKYNWDMVFSKHL